jgi:ornithine cyclodeaminase
VTGGPPWIDERSLFELVPFGDAATAVKEALLGGLDPSASPPRAIVEVGHGQLLLMPAEFRAGVGVKVGTVAPANPTLDLPRVQAVFVLLDARTLTPTALVDGTALTTLRTPAVSAVAVGHLAPASASRLLVFGSGPQAWGHVLAVRSVRPVDEVTVVARDRGRAEALAQRLVRAGMDATALEAVADTGTGAPAGVTEALRQADLVVCATTAREPLFDGRLLSEDACVVAVGSHDPAARELDEVTFRRATRVVVEDADVAMREAGDVVLAVEAGALSRDALVDLPSAVRLSPPGGVTVFKSVGMGWQDLVVAQEALRRWRERGWPEHADA